jgi:hypothetical protein
MAYSNNNKVYVGKTGSHFRTRYKEDIHDIKYNKDNSKYAAHILGMQHEYGKTEDPMGVLKIMSNGKDMDAWKQLHIHRLNEKKSNCQ